VGFTCEIHFEKPKEPPQESQISSRYSLLDIILFSTGATALLGPGLWFSVSWSFHRRYDSLYEWSARRKAST
jgi:hypothetical protein